MSTNYKVIRIRQTGTNYTKSRFFFLVSGNKDNVWSNKHINDWYLNDETSSKKDKTNFKLTIKYKI